MKSITVTIIQITVTIIQITVTILQITVTIIQITVTIIQITVTILKITVTIIQITVTIIQILRCTEKQTFVSKQCLNRFFQKTVINCQDQNSRSKLSNVNFIIFKNHILS